MTKKLLSLSFTIFLAAITQTPAKASQSFISFCYHDIPLRATNGSGAVPINNFIQQIEYMRGNGAHFVSVDDILKAKSGEQPLPSHAVLLTFDDGCSSFRQNVLPILQTYRIPAVLAVVTSWVGTTLTADCENNTLLSWEDLQVIRDSGLIEIASHSHDMHKALTFNPQGSTAAAVISHQYLSNLNRYETLKEHQQRIKQDLSSSISMMQRKLAITPRVLVWPYGEYNQMAIEQAKSLGFSMIFNADAFLFDGLGDLEHLYEVPRHMLSGNTPIDQFAREFWAGGVVPHQIIKTSTRIIHADLDLLYDQDPAKQKQNIDNFIERIVSIKPSSVYLQAFSDQDGDGVVSEVYFPNSVLPMKADLFSFVMRALQIRGIRVYAWMPSLAIIFPDSDFTIKSRVRELVNNKIRPVQTEYLRLSPFDEKALKKVKTLYNDLSYAAKIDGILFQDDAYLSDHEDYHPAALNVLNKIIGQKLSENHIPKLNLKQQQQWTSAKTQQLIYWTQELINTVRTNRPLALSARTIYAPVLLNPESEAWFAQNYLKSIKAYDYVVVMTYPFMEKVAKPNKWIRQLVQIAQNTKDGIDKTVFKLQTVDWHNDKCINKNTIRKWMQTLISAGAHNIAYYPDNVFDDCPNQHAIHEYMSTETFPFKRNQR
ncbi:MAG: poly-beta-1,6-N-acetyl-D-glucosamine N-deacetylase PgaB [Deltaproteobacteria bacterium]|nr:poly-beta-1,6-N-acetyl-D-glucosamine N-deacetylase PgaB [Deltaproteobacteria bacterium]